MNATKIDSPQTVKVVHNYSCVYCRNRNLTKLLFKYGSCDGCYLLMHSVLRLLRKMPDYMFNDNEILLLVKKKFSILNEDRLSTIIPDVFEHVTNRKKSNGVNF